MKSLICRAAANITLFVTRDYFSYLRLPSIILSPKLHKIIDYFSDNLSSRDSPTDLTSGFCLTAVWGSPTLSRMQPENSTALRLQTSHL